MKNLIPLLILTTAIVSSCERRGDEPSAPAAIDRISGLGADTTMAMGQPFELEAVVRNGEQAQYIWTLDGAQVATTQRVTLNPTRGGAHTLSLEVRNPLGGEKTELTLHMVRGVSATSSKWISRIVEYRPAPGQFINTSLGNAAAAAGLVGKRGLASLGGWGGSITFGFDHTVVNGEGTDFVIHGNAFDGSSEPGIVMVAYDANGNGEADPEEWYELRGSEHATSVAGYRLSYTRPSRTDVAENVQWSDNAGSSGVITPVEFHKQCYYPLFLADNPAELTFEGRLLPATASVDANGIWSTPALGSGYADNASADYDQVVGGDPQTVGSNKFDISSAVDAAGRAVALKGIDFVRVYTATNQQMGWLGECSTEVCGAISLTVVRAPAASAVVR